MASDNTVGSTLQRIMGLLVPLCGCAMQAPATPLAPPRAGTLAITLHDHLAWPYETSRVVVVVDNVLVYYRIRPVNKRIDVGELGVAPGVHEVQLLVDATYPSGSAGKACWTGIRVGRDVAVGPGGASLDLEVHTRDATQDFQRRLEIGWITQGELPYPQVLSGGTDRPPPPTTDGPMVARGLEQCGASGMEESTLCRAAVWIEEARRQRDVVRLVCFEDKRTRLKIAAGMLRQTAHQIQEPGAGPELQAHARAKAGVLRERIRQLAVELNECAGRTPYVASGPPEPESACRGTDPLPEP